MTVDGKRNSDRPKLRWRYLVKEVIAINQMTTEMVEDRKHWHVMNRAAILEFSFLWSVNAVLLVCAVPNPHCHTPSQV